MAAVRAVLAPVVSLIRTRTRRASFTQSTMSTITGGMRDPRARRGNPHALFSPGSGTQGRQAFGQRVTSCDNQKPSVLTLVPNTPLGRRRILVSNDAGVGTAELLQVSARVMHCFGGR